MSNFAPLNPRPMLQSLINREVSVRLKWNGMEYRGTLVSADAYMNLLLNGANEYQEGKHLGLLGQVLIRCNNVLWIQPISSEQANGDSAMNG